MRESKLKKLTILSMMIALDVVLSPLFRIEGMAPMSSVMNVIAAVSLGPFYATIMAFVCGILRITLLGIPPLALTGAVFGAFLAGIFYQIKASNWLAAFGEIIGTGLLGSLLSYPVMVWFTGSTNGLFWFVYTPRFFGGAISGYFIALFVLVKLDKIGVFQKVKTLFRSSAIYKKDESQ